MMVKVGNKIYDSQDMPLMVILDEEEKAMIADMIGGDDRFCSYPSHMDEMQIENWMLEDDDMDINSLIGPN